MIKHYKFIISIFLIALVSVVVCIELVSFVNTRTFNELDSEYDTRLIEYYANEKTAKMYLDILTINNDKQYQKVKENLIQKLDSDLQNSLFKYDTYPLEDSEPTTYELLDIKGTIYDDIYTFKLDFIVKSRGYKRNIMTLIKIQDKRIVDVITL